MKESGIVNAIYHFLQYQENLGKLVFIRNNSGAFINPKGNFFRMGRPGSPDFLLFMNGGRCLHIEVKNERGKQNVAQLEYEIKVKQLGHQYYIVRSVDDVECLLNS